MCQILNALLYQIYTLHDSVPHLHVYREGYGDRFAYEVPPGMLKNPDNPLQVLLGFLATYNIERNGIVDLPQTDDDPIWL